MSYTPPQKEKLFSTTPIARNRRAVDEETLLQSPVPLIESTKLDARDKSSSTYADQSTLINSEKDAESSSILHLEDGADNMSWLIEPQPKSSLQNTQVRATPLVPDSLSAPRSRIPVYKATPPSSHTQVLGSAKLGTTVTLNSKSNEQSDGTYSVEQTGSLTGGEQEKTYTNTPSVPGISITSETPAKQDSSARTSQGTRNSQLQEPEINYTRSTENQKALNEFELVEKDMESTAESNKVMEQNDFNQLYCVSMPDYIEDFTNSRVTSTRLSETRLSLQGAPDNSTINAGDNSRLQNSGGYNSKTITKLQKDLKTSRDISNTFTGGNHSGLLEKSSGHRSGISVKGGDNLVAEDNDVTLRGDEEKPSLIAITRQQPITSPFGEFLPNVEDTSITTTPIRDFLPQTKTIELRPQQPTGSTPLDAEAAIEDNVSLPSTISTDELVERAQTEVLSLNLPRDTSGSAISNSTRDSSVTSVKSADVAPELRSLIDILADDSISREEKAAAIKSYKSTPTPSPLLTQQTDDSYYNKSQGNTTPICQNVVAVTTERLSPIPHTDPIDEIANQSVPAHSLPTKDLLPKGDYHVSVQSARTRPSEVGMGDKSKSGEVCAGDKSRSTMDDSFFNIDDKPWTTSSCRDEEIDVQTERLHLPDKSHSDSVTLPLFSDTVSVNECSTINLDKSYQIPTHLPKHEADVRALISLKASDVFKSDLELSTREQELSSRVRQLSSHVRKLSSLERELSFHKQSELSSAAHYGDIVPSLKAFVSKHRPVQQATSEENLSSADCFARQTGLITTAREATKNPRSLSSHSPVNITSPRVSLGQKPEVVDLRDSKSSSSPMSNISESDILGRSSPAVTSGRHEVWLSKQEVSIPSYSNQPTSSVTLPLMSPDSDTVEATTKETSRTLTPTPSNSREQSSQEGEIDPFKVFRTKSPASSEYMDIPVKPPAINTGRFSPANPVTTSLPASSKCVEMISETVQTRDIDLQVEPLAPNIYLEPATPVKDTSDSFISAPYDKDINHSGSAKNISYESGSDTTKYSIPSPNVRTPGNDKIIEKKVSPIAVATIHEPVRDCESTPPAAPGKRNSMDGNEASVLAGHISYNDSLHQTTSAHKNQLYDVCSDDQTEYHYIDQQKTLTDKLQQSPSVSNVSLSQHTIQNSDWQSNVSRRSGFKDLFKITNNSNQSCVENWLSRHQTPDDYTMGGDSTQFKTITPCEQTTLQFKDPTIHSVSMQTANDTPLVNTTSDNKADDDFTDYMTINDETTINSVISGIERLKQANTRPQAIHVPRAMIHTESRITDDQIYNTNSNVRINFYITNLTDRDLKVGLLVETHLVNGRRQISHGLFFSPQINLTKSNTPQRFSMGFSSHISGRHEITLGLTPMSQPLCNINTIIQLDIESPCIELVDNRDALVDFSVMSYGCRRRIPVTLINKGGVDAELILDTDETASDRGSWQVYPHMYGDSEGTKPEKPLYNVLLKSGYSELSQKTVYLEFITPSTHGEAGSPEEIESYIIVKLNQTRSKPVLNIKTKVICGYGCIQFPGKYKVVELRCKPGLSASCTIKCKNGGDVASQVTFNTMGSIFTLSPSGAYLQAGEIMTVTVRFNAPENNNVSQLDEKIISELISTLEPNGRTFKIDLCGYIEKPSPIPRHLTPNRHNLPLPAHNSKPLLKIKPAVINFGAVPLGEKRYVTAKIRSEYDDQVKVFLDTNHPSVFLVTNHEVTGEETSTSDKSIIIQPHQPLPIRLVLHSTHVGPITCRLKFNCKSKSLNFRLPVYGYAGSAHIEVANLALENTQSSKDHSPVYRLEAGNVHADETGLIKKIYVRNVGHTTAFIRMSCFTAACCSCVLEPEKLMISPHTAVLKPADAKCVTVHMQLGEREKVLCSKHTSTIGAIKLSYVEESMRQIIIRNEAKNPSGSPLITQFTSSPAEFDCLMLPDVACDNRLFKDSVKTVIIDIVADAERKLPCQVSSTSSIRNHPTSGRNGLRISCQRLDFYVDINQTQTYKISISNSSNTDKQVDIQAPARPFIVKTKSVNIRAGYSVNLPVYFKPEAHGSYQCQVVIITSADSFRHVVDLKGLCR